MNMRKPMAAAGLLAFALFAQQARPAADTLYLTCRPNDSHIACMENAVLAKISGQDLVPYFTPAPEYPSSLARRGVTGWVLVGLTITEQGRVANAVVLNAEPKELFDAAALKAVADYRFHPPKTPMDGVTIQLQFSRR